MMMELTEAADEHRIEVLDFQIFRHISCDYLFVNVCIVSSHWRDHARLELT